MVRGVENEEAGDHLPIFLAWGTRAHNSLTAAPADTGEQKSRPNPLQQDL